MTPQESKTPEDIEKERLKQAKEFAALRHQQWLSDPHTIFVFRLLTEYRDKVFDEASNSAIAGNKKLANINLIRAGSIKQLIDKIGNVQKFVNG